MDSSFSDLQLLHDYQKSLAASGKGPQTSQGHLVAYLKAEQRLGRVRADADTALYSEVILGLCFQRAFRDKFTELPTRNKKNYAESDLVFSTHLAGGMAKLLIMA